MERPKVLIIGAGIGGIATAARLARHGYRVTVVEKGEQAGGRCNRLVKSGHIFDTGATLFLMPGIYAQTFADLGERIEDHLDLRRIDPTYHIFFDDGSHLALTSDLTRMKDQIEAMEPGSFPGLLGYLSEGHRHYKLSLTHLVGQDFRLFSDFFNLKVLLVLLRLKVLRKHVDYVEKFFTDPRLKIAFTFQNMYMGLNPFEAPATYSLLQYTELADGIWYPMRGMYRIIEALVGIAEESGVRFLYNAPVERILVEGRRAIGAEMADGGRFKAEIVVANADLTYVYRHLLPDDGTAGRLDAKEYGCSTVMFYWGLDQRYPQLSPHNLFLASSDRRGFDPIFQGLALPEEPNFYLHVPSRVDPSMAPEGHETITVAVPVGHVNEAAPQDWEAIRSAARRAVLRRLTKFGVSDFEDHIKFEVSATPLDWQTRYNLVKGSTHGLSHNLLQMGYLRPHNRHQRYRNLYFVGASTHPGTGLPTVLVSARHVAGRILDESGFPETVSTPDLGTARRGLFSMPELVVHAGGAAPKGYDTSMNDSAALARSITRAGSKQTYLTARLLVDEGLVEDCLRAYAYFRWADDVIDVSLKSREERIAFVERQKRLIDRLYAGERPDGLSAEEEIVADLIGHDREVDSGLHSYIRNFVGVLEFDARRKGQLIDERELRAYSGHLAQAVTDGILYFIGNGHPYPSTDDRYLAVTAAHITHMLRDARRDTANGFINIPRETLEEHGIDPWDVDGQPYRDWVRKRVELARRYFREGKRYLDELDVLRSKLAGYWYCSRYEGILAAIERDGYTLRDEYRRRVKPSPWLRITWLACLITLKHIARRTKQALVGQGPRPLRQQRYRVSPDGAWTDLGMDG